MTFRFRWTIWLVALVVLTASGCLLRKKEAFTTDDTPVYHEPATTIEQADVGTLIDNSQYALPPHSIRSGPPEEYWNLSLEEVVQIALANTKVLRDLGGTVVRSPNVVETTFGPALSETDPQFGVEAALSAFDAEFSTSLFLDDNDRRLNNTFLGDLGFVQRETGLFDAHITKRTPTGSQFTVRKQIDYEKDNSIPNEFTGTWTVKLEAEARQRLLQGRSLEFNRIAGPDAVPGAYNGVLIARVRTDISIAEFEIGVRDFVSNVENSYWDLYFSYRDLNSKIAARDAALETWRRIHALFVAGRKGGEAQNEAQAREQYFRFEEEVQNALTGRLLEPTRNFNGSGGGTFRGTGGVQVAERRLRLLMGLAVNDGRLIRPSEEPITANIVFDWQQIVAECLSRRGELRRQQWEVKRRELELIASRNFLLPSLDVVGLYRWRGFGDDLISSNRGGKPRFDNAYQDLTTGDFQEWQAGVEMNMPIGFRRAHAGVHNAEFQLARSRALLYEQEREVIHDAGNALANVERASTVMQTAFDRNTAAQQRLDAMLAAYKDNITPEQLFLILDAQRRLAETMSAFYRTQVEYALAIKNLHFAKGTLLEYSGVVLSEGPWPAKAHYDATRQTAGTAAPNRLSV